MKVIDGLSIVQRVFPGAKLPSVFDERVYHRTAQALHNLAMRHTMNPDARDIVRSMDDFGLWVSGGIVRVR